MSKRSLPAIFAFLAALTTTGLPLTGCDDAKGTCIDGVTEDAQVIPIGGSAEFYKHDCTTCGHAQAGFSWAVSQETAGEYEAVFYAVCTELGIVTAPEVNRNSFGPMSARVGNALFSKRGVKSPCGVNAAVSWVLRITNNTNSALDVQTEIDCPHGTEPQPANPAGPSRWR